MTEEGYEVMGPTGGGGGGNPAIPAFPVSTSGAEKPSPSPGTGGIPQFPVASHGSGAAPPPPPPPAGSENKSAGFVDDKESVMNSAVGKAGGGGGTSKVKGVGGGGKNKKKSKKKANESEMGDADGSRMENASSAPLSTNRPNTLDTCQLAMVIFFVVLVVAISIPVLLTATGSADIEYVKKNLQKL